MGRRFCQFIRLIGLLRGLATSLSLWLCKNTILATFFKPSSLVSALSFQGAVLRFFVADTLATGVLWSCRRTELTDA